MYSKLPKFHHCFPRFTHTYARTCSTLNDYFENSNNIYLSLISLINVYSTFVFYARVRATCHARVLMYVCMFNVYIFPYRGTVGNFFERTDFKFPTKSSIEIINSREFANDALVSFISIKITC